MHLPGTLVIASLVMPALLSAGSHAYIVASGAGNPTTPGAIAPFHTATGDFGAPYFVPPGGNLLAIAPGTHQIWQATTAPFCVGTCSGPFAINVLDPKTGSTLGSISLTNEAFALVFDSAGRYAYVSGVFDNYLAKIDVATRTIVLTVNNVCSGYLALSSDGSKLFTSGCNSISSVDPQTLAVVGSISGVSDPLFISGTTLLVLECGCGIKPNNELLYFDTSTLQQTNAVTEAAGSYLSAVSPDGSKIYLAIPSLVNGPSTLQILDFATGQVLLSQDYSQQIGAPPLSPDGKQLLVPGSQVLQIDAQTLAIIKTVTSLGNPRAAAYLDNDTALMLYPDTGAMMVVDQSIAQLTATFPLGMTYVSGEVADPPQGLLFTGSNNIYCDPICPNLNVVSTNLNRIIKSFPVEFTTLALVGSQLYGATGLYHGASVYNLSTGALTNLPAPKLPGPYYLANALPGAATPDGKTYWVPYIITNGYHHPVDSLVVVYDTATNQMSGHFPVPLSGAGPIVFRPDSSTAYIGESNLIAVYSTATLLETGSYSYTTTFTSLAISPDGSTLYATDGRAVYVLDAATGAQRQTYTLPSPVNGTMAISPDGTALFLTDSRTSSVDIVQTASGAITVVPLPYTPTHVVVLP